MSKIIFVYQDREEKTIDVSCEMSILQIAYQNDIDLEGTCRGAIALIATSSLSCQIVMLKIFDGLKVRLSEETRY